MIEIKGPLKGDPIRSVSREEETDKFGGPLLVLFFLVNKIVLLVFFGVFKFRIVLI